VSTTFQGVIEVQQPEKLAELLRKGIGPAKAFGCGLMLVRPD
jgi:CRISPR system Cascade subunit CasE